MLKSSIELAIAVEIEKGLAKNTIITKERNATIREKKNKRTKIL